MGIIRGGAFVIASVLLFILFLVGNILWTFNLSLEYDVLKPELASIIKDVAGEQGFDLESIEQMYPSMQMNCINHSEYVFQKGVYNFNIPCEIVGKGPDAIVDEGINDILNETYYGNYDCNFWHCFELTSQPFFLASKKAQEYWTGKFSLVMFGMLILICLMFFLIEFKTNFLLVVGALLIISSLPFTKLNLLLSFFSDKAFLKFFAVMFSQSYNAFLLSFAIGIGILIFGIFLKFFGLGFKIAGFFDKFIKKRDRISKSEVRSLVKEEVLKEKEVSKKIVPGEKKGKEIKIEDKKEGIVSKKKVIESEVGKSSKDEKK